MQVFGVPSFRLVNAERAGTLVKFHRNRPQRSLARGKAQKIVGKDPASTAAASGTPSRQRFRRPQLRVRAAVTIQGGRDAAVVPEGDALLVRRDGQGVGKVGVRGPSQPAEVCEGALHRLRVREGPLHRPRDRSGTHHEVIARLEHLRIARCRTQPTKTAGTTDDDAAATALC
ncbi:hypothetical protein [Amycolatopsis sulphurea]|nr:hypothetical protein [Amycolatopsis sulphurea]